ncbi:hypothetical protein [Rhodoferax sp.]|uniref:hypothetical protein n=1 Tax=Rhodoferax sp. TaxID=50421 RepID=UPI0027677B81|nr:hypothetical protein [Rhodoferax sp.]
MPEAIYDLEQLRKRVLAHLQEQTQRQPTGSIAAAIGVQMWAVEGELENLYRDKQVSFVAGAGWQLIEPPKAGPRPLSDDAQTPLGV